MQSVEKSYEYTDSKPTTIILEKSLWQSPFQSKLLTFTWKFQKQSPEVFCKKRCSWDFHKIYKKTPVPESLFFWKRCFPVNLAKFLRTPLATAS